MNIFEACRAVLKDGWGMGSYEFEPGERRVTVQAAQLEIMSFVESYNALAPDWTQAPDWAQWCVIHANGLQYFCDEAEPFFQRHVIGWTSKGMLQEFYRELELSIGIDWRLCKWQRPEGAK